MGADVAGPESADSSDELSDEAIVRTPPAEQGEGWRLAVRRLSGGLVTPRPGTAELSRRELLHRIRRPLPQPRHITVISMKGGVGRTTLAGLLGLVLAENRGDRVVAVDADPDAGGLADRLTGDSPVTLRELVRDLDRIDSWTAMSRYTSLLGRLQVLGSALQPGAGNGVTRPEFDRVYALLERYFDIIITDTGVELGHPMLAAALARADNLVVVGAPTVDAAGRASRTLDWLVTRGYGALAGNAVVVLSRVRSSAEVNGGLIRDHFARRCRAVVEIPHDQHLAVGGRIELGRLRPATRDAVYRLAALLADTFS